MAHSVQHYRGKDFAEIFSQPTVWYSPVVQTNGSVYFFTIGERVFLDTDCLLAADGFVPGDVLRVALGMQRPRESAIVERPIERRTKRVVSTLWFDHRTIQK